MDAIITNLLSMTDVFMNFLVAGAVVAVIGVLAIFEGKRKKTVDEE